MKRVEVTWVDSNALHGWTRKAGDIPLGLSQSCGYLVSQDEKHVVICLSTSVTGENLCTLSIPREVVQEIRYLRSR